MKRQDTYKFSKETINPIQAAFFVVALFILLSTNDFFRGGLRFKYVPMPMMVLFAGLALLIFLKWLWNFSTEISISPSGISCKTLFRKRFYAWKTLQSMGVYINRRRQSNWHLEKEEYGNFSLYTKYIWLSTEPDYLPRSHGGTSDDFIAFQYNQKALELIERYMQKRGA